MYVAILQALARNFGAARSGGEHAPQLQSCSLRYTAPSPYSGQMRHRFSASKGQETFEQPDAPALYRLAP